MMTASGPSSTLHRSLKWLWLWLHVLMLPLAAVYIGPRLGELSRFSALPAALAGLLTILAGTAALVMWLIAQSLLAMHRFPAATSAAAQLVLGYLVQLAVLAWAGESLPAAAFGSAYITLAALAVCGVALTARAGRGGGPGDGHPRGGAGCALGLLLAGLWPLAALYPLAAEGLNGMTPSHRAAGLATMAVNVFITVRTLVGFSIFGRPSTDDGAEADAEWSRWAAPTIILLILSAVAAVLVLGITRHFSSVSH